MLGKNKVLTPASPFWQRLNAFLAERFPLVSYGVLIVSYYSSNQFLAYTLSHPGMPMFYSGRSLLGAIILFCIFFHLRVFDEHKDYDDDLKFYPERVLQRGLITLTHLKWLGLAAITVEIILSLCCGFPAFVALAAVLLFSWLMLKEFFIGKWLKKHFLLYAMLHMLIMPLLALLVFSISTDRYFWEADRWFILYAFVGFFVTFNWEISRKIRVPDDEIAGLASYSDIFGTYGAAYMVILVRIIDTVMVFMIGWHLQLDSWFYLVLIILFLLCCLGLLQFRFNTSRKTAKMMEVYAGMYIIAFDLILAVSLISLNGLRTG